MNQNTAMNDLESQLSYPLGESLPSEGQALVVAPGVKWVRMALPFALNHINLWLLRDQLDGQDGWSIVDCCISHDESKAHWEEIFKNALEGLPVLRVIVTHMHPDHIGLAQWLCERWSSEQHECRLWCSATDFHLARIGSQIVNGFGGARAAEFYSSHGLNDATLLNQIRARDDYFPTLVPSLPKQFRRMMDGDVIRIGGREWRCISGYGHAPEHIALHCQDLNLLIGGDMMLPRISTNVSVFEMEPESNPLKLFLHSIDKFKPLAIDTLTLPSHGKPFTGLHIRIGQLHDHHRERLAEVMQSCQQRPHSAFDVMPVLFKRKLDLHQMTFAMGESIAHLHALWFEEKLVRAKDATGVFRFSAS